MSSSLLSDPSTVKLLLRPRKPFTEKLPCWTDANADSGPLTGRKRGRDDPVCEQCQLVETPESSQRKILNQESVQTEPQGPVEERNQGGLFDHRLHLRIGRSGGVVGRGFDPLPFRFSALLTLLGEGGRLRREDPEENGDQRKPLQLDEHRELKNALRFVRRKLTEAEWGAVICGGGGQRTFPDPGGYKLKVNDVVVGKEAVQDLYELLKKLSGSLGAFWTRSVHLGQEAARYGHCKAVGSAGRGCFRPGLDGGKGQVRKRINGTFLLDCVLGEGLINRKWAEMSG